VIGIVENSRFYAVDEPPLAMFFFPLAQRSESSMAVLVKTGLDRITLASTLTRELHALDARLTLSPLRAINDYTNEQLSTVEASTRLTSAIGMLAFVLAALGVFSVVSYNVAQRRREIAVRLALGASGASILLLLVRAGVVLTSAGLAAGALLGRLGVARVAEALDQLRPLETRVLFVAVALLGFCALAACVVPATRSLRVDVRKMLGPE
jgi:ABC-type antimicrobial peptide transport system permease subunit